MHSTRIHFIAKLCVGKDVAEHFRVESDDTVNVIIENLKFAPIHTILDVHLSYYGCNRSRD